MEKLQRTYMLAAMWKKEKWLKVERIMGAQSVSAEGESTQDVKSDSETGQLKVTTLTGGRVGREVFDHGALQRRNSPTTEHQSVSSNDPWEDTARSSLQCCSAKCPRSSQRFKFNMKQKYSGVSSLIFTHFLFKHQVGRGFLTEPITSCSRLSQTESSQ